MDLDLSSYMLMFTQLGIKVLLNSYWNCLSMSSVRYLKNFLNIHRSILQKRSFAQVQAQTTVQEDITLQHLKDADEGVAVINLNRTQMNAFSRHFIDMLNKTIDNVITSEPRVVLIKSNVPKVFCAGADLKERLKMSHKEVSQFSNSLRAVMTRIQFLPMPVIAAIDGLALGGGLELALACDIRVAATNVTLGLVETKLAIMPGAGGTVRLPRLINQSLAKELIFTSKTVDGLEAENLGLVNHAVKQNETGDAAYQKSLNIARDILPNGPVAIRMAKLSVNRGFETDLSTAFAIEEACYAQVIPTKDRMEGLVAFNEKRPPKYNGE